jgi:6-phosphogluconolactonase
MQGRPRAAGRLRCSPPSSPAPPSPQRRTPRRRGRRRPRAGETLVFVGSRVPATKDGIRVYAFDHSGPAFRPLAAIRGVASPTYLAYAPELGRFFAVSEVARHGDVDEGEVVAFDFDAATGATKPAWRRRSGGRGPCHLAVGRRGVPPHGPRPRLLLVAHYGDGAVTYFGLDGRPDGNAAPPKLVSDDPDSRRTGPVRGRQDGPHAHFVGMMEGGDCAFWCDLGCDRLQCDSLKTPSWACGDIALPPGSGPRHALRNGQEIYVVCELSSTIETILAGDGVFFLRVEEQATSTLPPSVPAAGNFPAAIKLSPDRRRLFVSNRGADLISTFDVEWKPDPRPTAHGSTYGPWPAVSFVPAGGAWPWDLDPSPDGRFLFVANYKSDEVVAFAVDPTTGAPTTVVARVAVEKPTCVVAAATTNAAASRPASSPPR